MADSACSQEQDGSDGKPFNDVTASLEGVTMLLNNEWEESQQLFNKYK